VILGYVKLLEDEPSQSETGGRYLFEVRKAAERAGVFTSQLLAFSRRQMVVPEVIDLNAHINQQFSRLQSLMGGQIVLKFDDAARSSQIRFDRGQLGQVLLNLAINARDAMPHGGALSLRTQNVELKANAFDQFRGAKPGKYVLLSVTDTGMGMNRETRSRIFEPFFSTKPDSQGAGLGLASVYGILKQSHGAIDVTSELGKGTTFRVYIPVCQDAATPIERAPALVEPENRESILLVDDEPGIREAIQKFLITQGYRVSIASDGAEALDLAGRQPFGLLISDMVMPNMSGPELLAKFRELHPKAAALLISGYTGKVDGQTLLGGATDFLQKPFPLSKLSTKIRELLDQSGRDATAG